MGYAYQPLNANDAVAQHSAGFKWDHPNGKTYRYLQYDSGTDAVVAANGMVIYAVDATGFLVTPDVSDAHNTQVRGVMQSVIDDLHWGWFQVGGVHDTVWTDGGVLDGDSLVGHTVDGEADTMADGEEEQVFAVALADDTTDTQQTVPALIQLNF